MKLTRRRFFESTGAIVAVGGLGRLGAAGQSRTARPITGAPGVDLNVDGAGLPDYSRDLERYLVRIANEARERRKRVVQAIATGRKFSTARRRWSSELWKMLGDPPAKTPLNPRVTGNSSGPAIESRR